MGYPSLLYYTKPNKKAIDISVFEDLQLLNFIPKRVAKSACVLCEKENILPRQELFQRLNDKKIKEKLAALYDIACELYSLNSAYKDAPTDEGKCIIFLFLCEAVRVFTEGASECDMGDPLSSRFASEMQKEKEDERYIKMSEELSCLIPEAEKLLTNSLCVSGNKVRMTEGGADTFLNGIISCAETLGTDIPKVKNPESRELSPDIVNGAASLCPELMKKLKAFKSEFLSYYRPNIVYYRKEIEFYLTMLDFTDRIREAGIPLTYPTVGEGRIISISEAYDVSLLAKGETNIVPNDISFTTEEPFYFLTGANGGGKTTYLRTVGIAVLMFLLGCPVACRSATISDISSIFAHFPRDERFDGSGRFVEENNRVNSILENMDENSLVLLNETYSTTNEENAVKMTEKLANELWEKRIFGLYITHQHGLGESEIPYLNVLIDLNDENRRTYKIARQKSVGGSYAKDILIRCGLTLEALENRFGKLDHGEDR
ncbi:MAG: hypothetical protein IJY94_01185 [Clostridia bacterium]|nr:hypothetical protein [Clostridia bacterium]